MKETDKILVSFGFVGSNSAFDEKFENFASNFGVQWQLQDLADAIDQSAGDCSAVRDALMSIMWDHVVSDFVEKGLDKELFDCYINGSLDTHFYYNSEEVFCSEELNEYLVDE